MTRDDIITLAREAGALQVGFNKTIMQSEYSMFAHEIERFAALVAAAEREAIAKMFDDPMRLVPFVQNHLGGCMVCGFTPKMAADSIRARGQQ